MNENPSLATEKPWPDPFLAPGCFIGGPALSRLANRRQITFPPSLESQTLYVDRDLRRITPLISASGITATCVDDIRDVGERGMPDENVLLVGDRVAVGAHAV